MLAERVDELLDEVLRRSGGTAPVPAIAPADAEDTAPLDTPIEEEFRVGTMSLAWDGDRERVVIECFEAGTDEDAPDAGRAAGRRRRRRPARCCGSRWPVRPPGRSPSGRWRGRGRPAAVPVLRQPARPEGHVCPRANGYRR